MTPVAFKEHNVVFGEGQPEYIPLPAYMDETDPSVPVLTCWEFTDEEIATLIRTKQVWLRQLSFGGNIQPLVPQVENPFVQEVTLTLRPFVERAIRSFITLKDISDQPTETLHLAEVRLKELLADLRTKGEPIPSFVSFNIGTISEFLLHRQAAENAHLN